MLDRDVRDVANVEQLDKLPKLLRVLAEHAGQIVNHSSFGAALSLSHLTAQRYVAILERLFLVQTLQPWSSNAVSRLIKTAKLSFLDSGLLAALRRTDASDIAIDRSKFGPLLENFVVSEIFKLASWNEEQFSFSHFRTREQEEVDLVIEDRRGRIVGVEVKASATVRPSDFNGLKRLQQAAGDKFVRGILLHDHDRVTPFAERLHAMPVSRLWTIVSRPALFEFDRSAFNRLRRLMRFLFLGDMVGRSGRTAVWQQLPGLISDFKLDFVVVNGENAAGGFGITEDIFLETINAGADAVTTGNHVWDQKEALEFAPRQERFVRPANYPAAHARARLDAADGEERRAGSDRQHYGPGVHASGAGRPVRLRRENS